MLDSTGAAHTCVSDKTSKNRSSFEVDHPGAIWPAVRYSTTSVILVALPRLTNSSQSDERCAIPSSLSSLRQMLDSTGAAHTCVSDKTREEL
jgi:hypothetical protein